MSRTRGYKSDIEAAIHRTASDLYETGLIDKQTMRDFDESCLTPTIQSPSGNGGIDLPILYIGPRGPNVRTVPIGTNGDSSNTVFISHSIGQRGVGPHSPRSLAACQCGNAM